MPTHSLPHNRSLSEQVCDLIEDQVIGGELSVGDKLPSENELAERYRVSRTVIREALKGLKEKGWVRSRAGKGTFVVDNTGRGVGSSIDAILRMNPESGFEYLLEVREMLEPEMAARAALRASARQIESLQALIAVMEQALSGADSLEEFLNADHKFHNLLAEATGNPLIALLVQALGKLMRDQQHFVTYHVSGGPQRSQRSHQRIARAIQARDPEAARAEMRQHIRQVRSELHDAGQTA